MMIDTTGKVGIGTGAPQNTLHVATAATDSRMQFTNSTSGSAYADGLWIGNDNTQAYIMQREDLPLTFWANAVERARITNGGLLLINTSTNSGLSNNVGGARYGHSFGGGQQVNSTNDDTALILNMSNGYSNPLVLFRYNGSTKGSISTNGSSTAYNTSSDYRLKENAVAISDLSLIHI